MASSSGGDAGDRKHKLGNDVDHSRQQHAAGMRFSYYDNRNGPSASSLESDAASDEWQSSSPSSTRQMLGDGRGPQGNGSSSRSRSAGRRLATTAVGFVKKKIDWGSLWDKAKEWIRNPMNMALFAWIVAVGVSGAILFMVMTGMLNRVLTTKSQKDSWFEVNNQILNALFTLMCLCHHPRRFYHLALLWRWRAGDMLQLRQAYCKDGTCKPDERKHMTVVVLLLHLNCFAQYALCGLNLGYRRPERPVVGVAVTISVAICAPAVAGLYNNLSPLGNDYEAQPAAAEEEEHQGRGSLQRKTTTVVFGDEEAAATSRSEWVGGLFDVWEDISLAYLSVFCSCCVFGWNMGRLGLGNMYVHIATFVLLCLAPFFILDLAAINIDGNEGVRDALGLAGIFLCVLGLLYGGFWRIQMRRRFRLPPASSCCGKPDLTDCLQWLCCYSCALAQEVRTGDALLLEVVMVQQDDPTPTSKPTTTHTTLQEELSTMQQQQPLGFPAPAAAARPPVSDNHGVVTVPPPVSVIRT